MKKVWNIRRQDRDDLVNVMQYNIVQWMMATNFELTSLARVKFPPHEPYIVATFTVCLVKWEGK